MNKTFNCWKNHYDSENLEPFNIDKEGQLWLKIKSIIRKELLLEFITKNSLKLISTKLSKQFEELYNLLANNLEESHKMLDSYMKEKNKEFLDNLDQDYLVSELYKLKVFEWGGDHQNSLEKYLIYHYVKAISSFEQLTSKFAHEINRTVQGYILNSWYNHWSSILIENIFKSHDIVLPTIGQIKGVDFFINGIPFDLKVTYFPSEYLKEQRRKNGLPNELTFLKSKARELGISFNSKSKSSDIFYEISEKMKDRGDETSLSILKEIKDSNISIIHEAKKNPKCLLQWLYENQGEMRFGAENRLFIVLVDSENLASSWKLKRNIELLKPIIYEFLDNFKKKKLDEMKIEFQYRKRLQTFKPLADIIFIIK